MAMIAAYLGQAFLIVCFFLGMQRAGVLDKKNFPTAKRILICYCSICVSFVFNLVYTGLLGWNWQPASEIERVLDLISRIWLIGSFVVMGIYMVSGARQLKIKTNGPTE